MSESANKFHSLRPRFTRSPWRRDHGNANLLAIFKAFCGVLLAYALGTSTERPLAFTLGGLLVSACALWPSYLWCAGKVRGLPIWPLACAGTLITYGIQLLASYARLQNHEPEAIWRASLTVAGFLVVGTFVWQLWLQLPPIQPRECLMIRGQNVGGILLGFLAASALYTMCSRAGWLDFLSGGIATAVRGFMRGPTAFAIFVLATRWGKKSLPKTQAVIFVALVAFYCIADAASLYLITSIAAGLMMLVGFAVGRKAIPWTMIAVFVSALGLLHLGKGEMRSTYWGSELNDRTAIAPWQYPMFYADWTEASLRTLTDRSRGDDQSASLLERANTIYLLLQAQETSPSDIPFLHGETYAIIPKAIVPRILWPSKVSPHDSTTMLNVHYGNQTWEAAQVTSIGWGLLNEAYANFGYAGCFGLAILLGSFYGGMARWSIGFPATSMRTFIGIFTMSFAIQTEMSAAVYISAYLQGVFALWIVVRLFSSRRTIEFPQTVFALSKSGRRRSSRRTGTFSRPANIRLASEAAQSQSVATR